MAKKTVYVPRAVKKKVVTKRPLPPYSEPEEPFLEEPTDELEDLDVENELAIEEPDDSSFVDAATNAEVTGVLPVGPPREVAAASSEPGISLPATEQRVPGKLTPPPPPMGTFYNDAIDSATVPEVPVAAVAPAKVKVSLSPDQASLETVATRLGVLLDYGELSVTEFRQLADLEKPHDPREAKRVLDSFVEQGLVETTWRMAKNRYKLTQTGDIEAKQLRARYGC